MLPTLCQHLHVSEKYTLFFHVMDINSQQSYLNAQCVMLCKFHQSVTVSDDAIRFRPAKQFETAVGRIAHHL